VYTVLRFKFNPENLHFLDYFGEKMNSIHGKVFTRADRIGNRFSLSVSDAADWNTHVQEINQFLVLGKDVFSEAKEKNIVLELDIAIEHKDLQETQFVMYKFNFLELLIETNVLLAITVYP
jgi:hypothetical protein